MTEVDEVQLTVRATGNIARMPCRLEETVAHAWRVKFGSPHVTVLEFKALASIVRGRACGAACRRFHSK